MNHPTELPLHRDLSADLPAVTEDQRHIGVALPREGARRLTQGRGQYIDDIALPRMAHVVFWRSPVAHMRITHIDRSAAQAHPGVIAVVVGSEVAALCKPWVATLAHLAGIKSAPQHAMAIDRATWQGEPVVAVVAETRAGAEDAMALLDVQWEALPAVLDTETALDPGTPLIHPELGDNLCFERKLDTGGVDEAFARADAVFEETYIFGRHTGVTLEPRCQIADWNPGDQKLTVHHSFQAPHMMQDLYCRQFGLQEQQVRVLCRDVGGSFGIKVHAYPDDFATVALSMLLQRPVKFVADRLESFVSDIHAREHRIKGRIAASLTGEILAFEIDDLTGIGPFSMFPRTSGIEGNQVVNLTGGPYKHQKYRARLNVVFTNKNVTCQYRAVGHPIAVALTEGIVDKAAAKIGMDPAEFRRKNLIPDDAYPYTFPSGIKFEKLSHHQCLDLLLKKMQYEELRKEQIQLRKKNIYRGIGLAAMIEVTNPSPAFYGVGGARISAQDGATLRLEPTGMVTVMCSVTEQGQGTEAIFAQIAASAVGVSLEKVKIITGDTGVTPYGGGTWASRGAGIGGEAVLLAGRALLSNVLEVASKILNLPKEQLTVRENSVIDILSTQILLPLSELGRVAYFRPDTLPMNFQSELTVTRHYTPREYGFTFTNGIQASLVEVDVDTGFVKLLKHWCVEDAGTVINPMLVDEQIRGGVVQGIGAALYEECLYSPEGQLLNGSMADYLVPMSGEMPDIICAHIETPTKQSQLGAKGVGEAGTAGAPGAIMNAINDALAPLQAQVTAMPFTPERILRALGKV